MTFYFVLFSLICIFAIVYGQRVKAMLQQRCLFPNKPQRRWQYNFVGKQ